MTEEKPADQQYEAVYLGVRVLSDGKLGDALILASDFEGRAKDWSELELGSSVFNRDDRKSAFKVVGGVYEVTGQINDGRLSRLITSRAKFLHAIRDQEMLVRLESSHDAARMAHRAKRLEEKMRTDRKLDNLMMPLRRVYHAIPPADRQAFRLMVLRSMEKRP